MSSSSLLPCHLRPTDLAQFVSIWLSSVQLCSCWVLCPHLKVPIKADGAFLSFFHACMITPLLQTFPPAVFWFGTTSIFSATSSASIPWRSFPPACLPHSAKWGSDVPRAFSQCVLFVPYQGRPQALCLLTCVSTFRRQLTMLFHVILHSWGQGL